jgi:hypothetical protein
MRWARLLTGSVGCCIVCCTSTDQEVVVACSLRASSYPQTHAGEGLCQYTLLQAMTHAARPAPASRPTTAERERLYWDRAVRGRGRQASRPWNASQLSPAPQLQALIAIPC